MVKSFFKSVVVALFAATMISCTEVDSRGVQKRSRYDFAGLLDISVTPDSTKYRVGCFTDAGSWMGFTIPQEENWINGFCGPFSLDNRVWFAQSAVEIRMENGMNMTPDSVAYFPGEVYLSSSSGKDKVVQRLIFVNATTALLEVETNSRNTLIFQGRQWNSNVRLCADQHTLKAVHSNGEIVTLTFPSDFVLSCHDGNYCARLAQGIEKTWVAVSFFPSEKEVAGAHPRLWALLNNPEKEIGDNALRWNGYLEKVLRRDMKPEYDRVAVKAIMTLISNWRTHREGLLHEGVIPSHAVEYFIGFWAWDSWRFAAALARFAPELAKNNIRAMFDYQLPDGMIVDCIYTDPKENNLRDSKPPLAAWAVNEIFIQTQDTAFVKEMYPQLLSYYKWWYEKRDHDKNGMCEFGSTDGTLEAAAWESGMDNAIRFDEAEMVCNSQGAWSMNQESVDLNAYLAYECKLLKKFAVLTGSEFDGPDYSSRVADYFFDGKSGWFCDRRLGTDEFIEVLSCEGYTPFWTQIADKKQMEKALSLFTDTARFATYIPFPTAAADNPKCNPKGYWRGPIWLDQTYFAIRGLRNYGYTDLADRYTEQVFTRCQGLIGDKPVHENYGTHTGERLKAPHFSWSAAHLLMMYEDFGR